MDLHLKQLIKDMSACEQTKGMTVLEHGELVYKYYNDLMRHLRDDYLLELGWLLPEWIYRHKDLILSKVYDDDIMKAYQIYHDCGKPYCRTVDIEGKQHFPDHAAKSFEVWDHIFGRVEDPIVGTMIRQDMDIHCLKGEGVDEFASRPQAVSLMLTGLSEVHANASMFGGMESTSFKIKWKQIDKRGRQVLNKMGA